MPVAPVTNIRYARNANWIYNILYLFCIFFLGISFQVNLYENTFVAPSSNININARFYVF